MSFRVQQFVHPDHQSADDRVKRMPLQVIAYLLDGFVQAALSCVRSGPVRLSYKQPMQLPEEIVNSADSLGVPRFVLGEWSQEHFIASEGVGSVAFHQFIGRLHVEFGFGHFFYLMTAHVFTRIVQDESRLRIFRTPSAESIQIQFIGLDQVDVDVKPLCCEIFSLFVRHKFIRSLHAVHEIGTPQDHSLIDHLLERLVEAYPTPVE